MTKESICTSRRSLVKYERKEKVAWFVWRGKSQLHINRAADNELDDCSLAAGLEKTRFRFLFYFYNGSNRDRLNLNLRNNKSVV